MMVVDANVIVSNFVPTDVHHQVSKQWIQSFLVGGSRLVAPTILLAEVCGAITRVTGQSNLANQVGNALLAMAQLRLLAVDQQLGELAMHIGVGLRLKGADAVYVAVADQLQISLVTWDNEVLQRGKSRITIYTPHDLSGTP